MRQGFTSMKNFIGATPSYVIKDTGDPRLRRRPASPCSAASSGPSSRWTTASFHKVANVIGHCMTLPPPRRPVHRRRPRGPCQQRTTSSSRQGNFGNIAHRATKPRRRATSSAGSPSSRCETLFNPAHHRVRPKLRRPEQRASAFPAKIPVLLLLLGRTG
ncbi:MAG: hypothetical protein MZW92_52930 [Comamonadaceae bacterium]|nr:hypothetical protein [Comamonadaceae bacterium]